MQQRTTCSRPVNGCARAGPRSTASGSSVQCVTGISATPVRQRQRTERACVGCSDVDERGRPKLARWRILINEYACESCWAYYQAHWTFQALAAQEADPVEALQALPGVEIVGPEA